MNILEILNFLNPTGLANTIFYPLLKIFASYCAAFLLSRNYPKNQNLLILISIPILVSIISISLHLYKQLCTVITDYSSFEITSSEI